ncbi:MAG: ThiF family adenylyltransferase, partial [Pirellulaceae bacterium]
PWIDGGIQEVNGVAKVFMPPDGACYECGMTEMDYQLIQLRYSCPLLKREDLLQGKVPTAPTIASIIGGLQVQEALKLLHGIPTDHGSAMVFNGAANQFYKSEFQHRDDCLSHETYEPIIESEMSCQNCLSEVVESLQADESEPVQSLSLDRDLVISLDCGRCQTSHDVMRTRPEVSMNEAVCSECQEPMAPSMLHVVDIDHELATQPLARMGVPDREILQLNTAGDPLFVQLAPQG